MSKNIQEGPKRGGLKGCKMHQKSIKNRPKIDAETEVGTNTKKVTLRPIDLKAIFDQNQPKTPSINH